MKLGRLNAQEQAAEVIDLIKSELLDMSTTHRRIFLGVLGRFCKTHNDTPERLRVTAAELQPFNESESKRFDSRPLPDVFKKHAGQKVRDVPVDYLCWLTDPKPFIKELRRYMKSRRGRSRIENE